MCECDIKLVKKAAWKYILMKDSSYAKVATKLGISSSKVGNMLRNELEHVSPLLYKWFLRKKEKNELRAQTAFVQNVVKKQAKD